MRINVSAAGTWGLPGGHLEAGEGMADAVARELLEETGLTADHLEFSNITNQKDGYVQVGFAVTGVRGEPTLKEPDRCEEWKWFPLTQLPANICQYHL